MIASIKSLNSLGKNKRHAIIAGSALLMAFGSSSALATNGYLAHGYGVKAQGIAGIGVALPQDALAAATNPAGTALVGDRVDLGVTLFRPSRESTISGNGAGANGTYDGNDTQYFVIPEISYTKQLTDSQALGVAVYGNGGMNTDYKKNPYAAFGSTGSAGVNLEQLFITPSYAYKINEDHSIGVGINLVYQTFEAKGLQAFAGASSAPTKLSNNGKDSSTGAGLRLGWTGNVSKDVTLGLTWASRTNTSEFKKYKGLFAEQGGFDIPENFAAGIAWRATPQLTLASDYQRILYNDIDSVGQPLSNLTVLGNPLGSDKGAGFGWKNVNVYKFGATYAVTNKVSVRGGYSYSGQPVPTNQTFFNILAPGVVQNHLTLGATWQLGAGELSASYAHAFSHSVKGKDSIPAGFGGGNADLEMTENLAGISYAWKL